MNFNDLDEKELNPAFGAYSKATVMEQQGNYLKTNTEGVLEVKSIEYRDGYKGQSFITKFVVVSSSALEDGVEPHAAGSEVTWVQKVDQALAGAPLKERDKAAARQSAALTGLLRIAGLGKPDPSQIAAFLTKVTSSAQPLAGYRVAYNCAAREGGRGYPNFFSLPGDNTPEKVAERNGSK